MNAGAFSGEAARSYAERPARQVPGFADLQRMAMLLLAERMPQDGRLLVLGAGGGLELKAFAEAQAGWCFDGVDPSADMLALAARMVEPHEARVSLHEGIIDVAPEGLFDGATCILTFHFIAREARLETLRQIRRRLKPGAPFILAHISVPQEEAARLTWLGRHVDFGAGGPMSAAQRASAVEALQTRLTVLSPEEEVAMLAEAGFVDVGVFYAGFAVRGWVGYAG